MWTRLVWSSITKSVLPRTRATAARPERLPPHREHVGGGLGEERRLVEPASGERLAVGHAPAGHESRPSVRRSSWRSWRRGAWGLGAAILGAILVQVVSVPDGVDGAIARLQVRASPGDALLDGVLDRLADAVVIAGLAVWALESGGRRASIVVLAVAATAGSILSMASKDRVTALRIPPAGAVDRLPAQRSRSRRGSASPLDCCSRGRPAGLIRRGLRQLVGFGVGATRGTRGIVRKARAANTRRPPIAACAGSVAPQGARSRAPWR